MYNKQKQINNPNSWLSQLWGRPLLANSRCSGANENLQILILGRVQKENASNILKSSVIYTPPSAQGKRLKCFKIFRYWYSAERTRKTLEIFKIFWNIWDANSRMQQKSSDIDTRPSAQGKRLKYFKIFIILILGHLPKENTWNIWNAKSKMQQKY